VSRLRALLCDTLGCATLFAFCDAASTQAVIIDVRTVKLIGDIERFAIFQLKVTELAAMSLEALELAWRLSPVAGFGDTS
jgi:hypothetical protein